MKKFTQKMLSAALALLVVMSAVPFGVIPGLDSIFAVKAEAAELAETGQCGENVFWSFDSETGTLTLTGTGGMNYYITDIDKSPFYNNDSIISVEISYGISNIGGSIFCGCSNLTSITIPDSVTSIEARAFQDCKNLTSIIIPDSVKVLGIDAFVSCKKLSDITLSANLTSIGDSAFQFCSSLESITIPDSVTSIDSYAFEHCYSLKSINIPNGVTHIGADAFYDCSSLQSITVDEENEYYSSQDGALLNKDKTELIQYPIGNERDSYIIPNCVTSIGRSAFYNCSCLKSVVIGNSVINIGNYAFRSCSNIESVIIGNSVTSVGAWAFQDCGSLKQINIPNSVTSIGDWPFGNCGSLQSITVDEENEYYSSQDDVLFNKDKTELIQYPLGNERTSYVIPSGVTSIGRSAFYYCSTLTDINIPNGVNNIGERAFSECRTLTSINIPNSVTSIGSYAFSICSSLKSVVIGNSVTNIKNNAFNYCSLLTDVYYKGTEEEWSAITINSNNEPLLNATIHYNYTDETDDIETGQCGENVYWSLNKTIGVLTITGTGDMYDYSVDNSPFYNNSSINTVIISDGVIKIGKSAFYCCKSLKDITIPNSVTSIDENALNYCISLERINIPNSVTNIKEFAFYDCRGLKSITVDEDNEYYSSQDGVLFNKNKTELIQYPIGNERASYVIPNSVTSISNRAFSDCSRLTSINIPNSVTSIGYDAFQNCSNLESVVIGNGVTSICDRAFSGCRSLKSINIPDSVTSLSSYVFENCGNLKSVVIGNSVTRILYGAFYNCSSLESVVIGNNVTSIGNLVFMGCTSLTEITIPNSVTSIYPQAFRGCISLSSITIPDSVTSIGNLVFSGCTSLTDVYYTGTEEQWNAITIGTDNEPLLSANIHYNYTEDTDPIDTGQCGENVYWSFDRDSGRLNITGSGAMYSLGSIEEYGWYAFKDDIDYVKVSDNVTSIGANAFSGCEGLREVYLGKNVTSIGANAFAACSSLALVTVTSMSLSAPDAFSGNSSKLTFIVNEFNSFASTQAKDTGANVVTYKYYIEEIKRKSFNVLYFKGNTVVYEGLDYNYLTNIINNYPGTQYMRFDKLIFDGVYPETITISDEDIIEDTTSQYFTLKDLYVSLEVIRDGNSESITFGEMIELLKSGNYDAFKLKLGSDVVEIFQKVVEFFEGFTEQAIRVITKAVNFVVGIFKKK